MIEAADLLVVGAGFYGATVAERLAAKGRRVRLIDRRPHVGGNAYSTVDAETGIEKHLYGAHVFHTSNRKVWDYLNRFGSFTDYTHRVFTVHRDRVYPLPITLDTLSRFYERRLSPAEARALVAAETAGLDATRAGNLEQKAIASMGRPLYAAFVEGYTRKQWQVEPRELPPEIISRLPIRYDFDTRYFRDAFQGLPRDGYASLFANMLAHANIETRLGVDFFDIRAGLAADQKILFTGPIDRFYGFAEGPLGWRTTDFEWERPPVGDFQGTSVMNYADPEPPWTRIIEFRHFHPERAYPADRTLIAREFPRAAGREDEPFYPVGTARDMQAYRRYRERAQAETHVRFGGRLGTYRYLDMHQAVGAALADVEEIERWIAGEGRPPPDPSSG